MIAYAPARSGEPTASHDGRWIHSRYDPRIEARRFIERETADQSFRAAVIFGDGLGYLVDALRVRFPSVRVIWMNYHRDLFHHRIADADAMWHGDDPPDRFLDQEILDEESSALLVLTWEPAARAFPDVAERCLDALRALLDRRTAVLATEGYFGRRWLRNSVRNAVALSGTDPADPRTSLRNPSVRHALSVQTVIIAAAGPSLAESLADLAHLPDTVRIWALPSAASVLLDAGIRPDLVVATDGGAYAIEHLKPLRGLGIPVAAPLSAALDRPEETHPIVLLDQGTWFERDLIAALRVRPVSLPPHGTVAGSAWYLAKAAGVRTVYFAGLDLCTTDLHAHPPGHRFERILWPHALRTNPVYTTLYRRSVVDSDAVPAGVDPRYTGRARMSRSMRVYAQWFAAATHPTRAVRVRPSAVSVGIPAGDLPRADRTPSDEPPASGVTDVARDHHSPPALKDPGDTAALRSVVDRWFNDLECLPTALTRDPRRRTSEESRACEIARTVETAEYLKTLRSPHPADTAALVTACHASLARCVERLLATGAPGGAS